MSLWEWSAWSKGWDQANTPPEEGGPLTEAERAEAMAMLDEHN